MDLKESIVNKTTQLMKDSVGESNIDNAISQISIDFTRNFQMQEDVKKQYLLQREIVPISSFVNNKA